MINVKQLEKLMDVSSKMKEVNNSLRDARSKYYGFLLEQ